MSVEEHVYVVDSESSKSSLMVKLGSKLRHILVENALITKILPTQMTFLPVLQLHQMSLHTEMHLQLRTGWFVYILQTHHI